jgi:hypothetical protein
MLVYFAAAILLYMHESRTQEEEAAFQHLNLAWQHWCDGAHISYQVLETGQPIAPPLYAYDAEEINWCKTRLEFLDKQIKETELEKVLDFL